MTVELLNFMGKGARYGKGESSTDDNYGKAPGKGRSCLMTRTLLALALVSLALLQPAVNAEVTIEKDAKRTILLEHNDEEQHYLCVMEAKHKMQSYAANH